jgi:maleate cis-trans isomerase
VFAVTETASKRRVLGVLVPYFNTAVEHELADLRPPGVSNQTARFTFDADVLQNVLAAARHLAVCGPEVFLVGISTEFLPNGLALLRQGADEVAAAVGIPVVTASHATHEALRHLALRRIAVVTPFDEAANENVRAGFEEGGFSVVRTRGLACPSFDAIGRTPLADVRRAFHAVDSPDADALVQVGTGLPTLDLVQELEAALRKPVITCNTATYWRALREIGFAEPIAGYGRLLEGRR